MKTFISILIIHFLLLTSIQAQTKKIALRSHSGANETFTLHLPDEFGRAPIEYYEAEQEVQKERIRQKRAEAKKKRLEQKKLPKMPNNGFEQKNLDSSVCRPNINTNKIQDTTTTDKPILNKPILNKQKQQHTKTPAIQTVKQPKETGRKMNFPKQNPKTIQQTPPSPKKGSLNYLFWLLTIPAILSLITKTK